MANIPTGIHFYNYKGEQSHLVHQANTLCSLAGNTSTTTHCSHDKVLALLREIGKKLSNKSTKTYQMYLRTYILCVLPTAELGVNSTARFFIRHFTHVCCFKRTVYCYSE